MNIFYFTVNLYKNDQCEYRENSKMASYMQLMNKKRTFLSQQTSTRKLKNGNGNTYHKLTNGNSFKSS